MKNLLSKLYTKVVAKKQKAIAAFLVGAVGSFVAKHGLTLDASLVNYVQAFVVGVLAHAGVFFTSNK